MTLFKNKPFLTASMFLAVLGSTSLLSSPGFSMDPAAEDVVDTTQAPVRPYPAEQALVIEDLLAKFRDPATPEDERTKAGKALLFTKMSELSYGKEQDDFDKFLMEQVFSLSVDERIPVQTRIKYVSGFIVSQQGDSFFYYPNRWHYCSTPYTERASDILLPFLVEENDYLIPQRRFTLLRDVARCGNTTQVQRVSGILLSFFDDAASPHLVSVQERLDLLDHLIRANRTTGQCVPPILRALPLLEDLTNSLSVDKRLSTAKAILEIGNVWQTGEKVPGEFANFKIQAAQVLLRLAEESSIPLPTRMMAAKESVFWGAPASHREQSSSVLLALFQQTALQLSVRVDGLKCVVRNGTDSQQDAAYALLGSILPEEMSDLIENTEFLGFMKDLITAYGDSAEIKRKREKAATFLSTLVGDQRFSQDLRIRFFDALTEDTHRTPFIGDAYVVVIGDPHMPFAQKKTAFDRMKSRYDLKEASSVPVADAFLALAEAPTLPVKERLGILDDVASARYYHSSGQLIRDLMKRKDALLLSLLSAEEVTFSFEERRRYAGQIIESGEPDLKLEAVSFLLKMGQSDKTPTSDRLAALQKVMYSSNSSDQRRAAYDSFETLYKEPTVFVAFQEYMSVLVERIRNWDLPHSKREAAGALAASIIQHPEYRLEHVVSGLGGQNQSGFQDDAANAALAQKLAASYASLSEWDFQRIASYIAKSGTEASKGALLTILSDPEAKFSVPERIRYLSPLLTEAHYWGDRDYEKDRALRERVSELLLTYTEQEAPSAENHHHRYEMMRVLEHGNKDQTARAFPILLALSEDPSMGLQDRKWNLRSVIGAKHVPEDVKANASAKLLSINMDPSLPVETRAYSLTEIIQSDQNTPEARDAAVQQLVLIGNNAEISAKTRVQVGLDILHQHSKTTGAHKELALAFLLPVCESAEEIPVTLRVEGAKAYFYHSTSTEFRQRANNVLLAVSENPQNSLDMRLEVVNFGGYAYSPAQRERASTILISVVESAQTPLESRINSAIEILRISGETSTPHASRAYDMMLDMSEGEKTPLKERVRLARTVVEQWGHSCKPDASAAQKERARKVLLASLPEYLRVSSEDGLKVTRLISEGSSAQKDSVLGVLVSLAESAEAPLASRINCAMEMLRLTDGTSPQRSRAFEVMLGISENAGTPLKERVELARRVIVEEWDKKPAGSSAQKARARNVLVEVLPEQVRLNANQGFWAVKFIREKGGSQAQNERACEVLLEVLPARMIVSANENLEMVRYIDTTGSVAQQTRILAILSSVAESAEAPLESRISCALEMLRLADGGASRRSSAFDSIVGISESAGTPLKDRIRLARLVLEEKQDRKPGASDAQKDRARNVLAVALGEWPALPETDCIELARMVCASGSMAQKEQVCASLFAKWNSIPVADLGRFAREGAAMRGIVEYHGTGVQKLQARVGFSTASVSVADRERINALLASQSPELINILDLLVRGNK